MPEVGSASLAIIPSFKGFQGNLERGVGTEMTGAGRKGGSAYAAGMASSMRSRAKSIFAPLLAAGAAYKAGQFLKDSVGEASDLNESLNAVNVSYGKNSKGVKKLGREAANALGLSNNEFNSLSVRFSAFSKTIAGTNGKKVVTTLDDLTTRASDFASVMNLEVNEAAELFQSGLAGETEPLRRFGIDLSAAAVESFAYANGIAEAGDKLTESQKVQARYAYLMKQTAQTQGDFKNTSDQLANSQRILNARWDNAKAKFGAALLPVMKQGVRFLLNEGVPAFERFSDWFVKDGIPAIKDFGGFLRDDVAPPLKKAAGFAKDLVGWLNDLPKPAKLAGLAALLGGIGYGKLRGGALGSNGILGGIGKAVGLAKPVPVFVTNAGALGGPGGPGSRIPPAIIPTGEALSKGAKLGSRLRGIAPILPAAGALGNDQLPKMMPAMTDAQIERWKSVNSQARIFNDATKKLPNQLDQGNTSAENLLDTLLAVGRSDPKVEVSAPGFDALFDKTVRYGSLLDGLNRTVVTNFVQNVTRNNDTGEGGGGTVPGRSPREGVTVNIDRVEAHNYRDFMDQMQRRTRGAALDGVR